MVRSVAMKQPGRGTSFFCIAVGVLMFVLWTVLLATEQVAGIQENALAFAFHWTAEFLTAIALVIAGVSILKGATFYRRLYYFATGLLVIAAAGAVLYYILVEFDVVMVVVLSVIVGCAKVIAWRTREGASDLLFLVLGVVLYGVLIVVGLVLQTGGMVDASYLLIMMAVTLPFTVHAFKRPL